MIDSQPPVRRAKETNPSEPSVIKAGRRLRSCPGGAFRVFFLGGALLNSLFCFCFLFFSRLLMQNPIFGLLSKSFKCQSLLCVCRAEGKEEHLGRFRNVSILSLTTSFRFVLCRCSKGPREVLGVYTRTSQVYVHKDLPDWVCFGGF